MSSYWLSMAQKAKQDEMIFTQKRNSFQEYLTVLQSLESAIVNTFNFAQSAKNNYQSGGYICDGETLDKGTLNNCYEILSVDDDVISNVISKLISDIEELNQKIRQAQRDYQVYMQNYYAALEEERRAAEAAARNASSHQSGKF